MRRKETLRGPGSPARQIDEVRRRRASQFHSQAELGNEFTTDGKQKLRLRPGALGIESLAKEVETLKKKVEGK